MKKEIMMWLLSRRQGAEMDKALKKKIFIGLGIFGLVLVTGVTLTVYVGFKTVGFIASKAPTQEQVGALTQNLSLQGTALVAATTSATCLTEVQSHMNLNVWLSRPIAENTSKLFKACFETQRLEPNEKQTETTEGA
jgi:hypothetical protein